MLKGHSVKVLIKADMLDYYNVSGCYVLKPWSYSIWEIIQGNGLPMPTLNSGTYVERL
jgi:prolyl-tRNA synthetase